MATEIDIVRDVSNKFEQSGIGYMLTGSMAMNYYAQPRMTRDIDLVVALTAVDTDKIVGLFVPDDMSKWPRIDPSDPTYQRDLASLQVRGEMSGHHGEHAGHEGMKEGMKMDSMPGMDHGQMDHGEHGAHQ